MPPFSLHTVFTHHQYCVLTQYGCKTGRCVFASLQKSRYNVEKKVFFLIVLISAMYCGTLRRKRCTNIRHSVYWQEN